MPTLHVVPDDIRKIYNVYEWRCAAAVLDASCPAEWFDILDVLRNFKLYKFEVNAPGGGRSLVSKRLDESFYKLGWQEKKFDTSITVDDKKINSPTHKIDCYKNNVALEIEWNNKDTFYDRDLNNFRLLFELRAIEVGVIITRSTELSSIFNKLTSSTTHFEKLLPKLEGGAAADALFWFFQ